MQEVEDPGTKSVRELMNKVDNGSFVLPYFQRGFEWEPSMVCDLFESIIQNYYTGLLLFWDLDSEKANQEEWESIWGAAKADSPDKAVLDGQQRLSSLYYAIYNPNKKFPSRKSYYLFKMDLVKAFNEEYEEAFNYTWNQNYKDWEELRQNKEKWIESGEVPLAILSAKDPENPGKRYIESKEFQEWAEKFIEENRSELPKDITNALDVQGLFTDIMGYNFVHYPLNSDRDMHDICNIFAKVNKSGMKLSTFDLMNAFLYPSGVNLRKELWENMDNRKLKEMDSSMNEYLLKVISLYKQDYCSSKYIYNLIPGEEVTMRKEDGTEYIRVLVEDREEFESLWEKACEYSEKARQIIMNTGDAEFGAIKADFIPNTTIVPVLAAILWEYDGDVENPEFKENLRKWYWTAVLSKDYSGSSDTVMAKDFRDWKDWMAGEGEIERIARVNEEFIDDIDFQSVEKGSSRYNAVLSLLALNDARDFYKKRIVGTGDYSSEKINDHHIFPKKVDGLEPEKSMNFEKTRDSIVNRTLLLDSTNKEISKEKPSEYIKEIRQKHEGEQEVKDILRTNLIGESAYEYLKENNYDKFIEKREEEIKQHIANKLDLS
jgi:hypothetical protein